ncbi:MAG: serine/threonine protein kinase, partial [Aromatoleum sp.]|nr:serine/threonine protein kinase [Aromatoleum sp.]
MTPAQIGRYEITGELGRGAMGIVYKARDPLINRTVAVKTVGLDYADTNSEAFEKRFYREAQSAGRLNHFNIVTIHDVGKSGDLAYIAMEFLEGRSLREIIDSGVVLSPERCAEIAAQVADGLAFAHDKQIVHRDIKPANIMVLDGGAVKITDFGIAQLPTATRNTSSGKIFGSPKYISPEHLEGRAVDGRSDVFSLGAVLYEMLTGVAPFTGTDLDSLLDQVMYVMPAAPSGRNRNIPPAFDLVVAMALAKDPDHRYASAADFASDLRQLRDSETPIIAAGRSLGGPPPAASQFVGDETVPFMPLTARAPSTGNGTRRVDLAASTGIRGLPAWALWGVPATLVVILVAWGVVSRRAPVQPPPAALPA